MKVKLFSKDNPLAKKGRNQLELENEINEWFKNNPSIKVIDIKQSVSGGSFSYSQFFISVWYEEVA